MNYSNLNKLYSDITEFDFLQDKNLLYSYQTSYGFIGQTNNYYYPSLNDDKCGIIIYNGEISENISLLVTADMPLRSTYEFFYYYEFPIIYEEDKDDGVLISFKIFVFDESIKEQDLYDLEILINRNKYDSAPKVIKNNQTLYIKKDDYKKYFETNNIGTIGVKLTKKFETRNYTITTKFMSSKISPEYILLNNGSEFQYNLRPKSSKYLYGKIFRNTKGKITFNNFPSNVQAYAKIVEKDKKEENYNWNGRVKLPESGDEGLIIQQNGVIEYEAKCSKGCEIYILIETNSPSENLIPIEMTFTYQESGPINYKNYEENL